MTSDSSTSSPSTSDSASEQPANVDRRGLLRGAAAVVGGVTLASLGKTLDGALLAGKPHFAD